LSSYKAETLVYRLVVIDVSNKPTKLI